MVNFLSSATNKLINAQDHASVQINIVNVDAEGRAIIGQCTSYALSGAVRSKSEADDSLNRLATEDGIVPKGCVHAFCCYGSC